MRRIGVLVGWLIPLLALAWAVRLVTLEGYIYPSRFGFVGDFARTASGETPLVWHGEGLYYGPVFVLEDRLLMAPGRVAALTFAHLNFGLFAIALVATYFACFGRFRPRLLLLTSAAWLAHASTIQAFADNAHLEFLELMCLGLALWLVARARCTAAGASLGLAAATKMMPILFMPYLAVLGRWRMLASTSLVAGALFLAACWVQAIAPWDGALMLIHENGVATKADSSEFELSLRASLIRTLTHGQGSPTPEQVQLAVAGQVLLGLLGGGVVAVVLLRSRARSIGDGLALALVSTLMTISNPSLHQLSFVLLLPAWTVALAAIVQQRVSAGSVVLGLGLAASYSMGGFDQPFVAAQRVLGVGQVVLENWLTWYLPNVSGVLILMVLSVLLLQASREPQTRVERATSVGLVEGGHSPAW